MVDADADLLSVTARHSGLVLIPPSTRRAGRVIW